MDKEIEKNMPVIRSILDRAEKSIEDMTGIKVLVTVSKIEEDDYDNGYKLIYRCCMIWGTNIRYISEKVRNTERVMMRKILAMLLKQKTKLSLREIGQRIGYRDHSDVIAAVSSGTNLLHVKDKIFIKYYEPVKEIFLEEVEQ